MAKSAPSIKEVAKLAGVSIATVSRFINTPDQVKPNTSKRVEKAIAEIGYSPNSLAQNFRRGNSRRIIVVIPSVGIPFYEGIMCGIQEVATDKNYDIMVKETQYNSTTFDDYSRMLFSKQADGIILLSTLSPFEDSNVDHKKQQPAVVLGLENVDPSLDRFPSVRIDNKEASKDAINYLIRQGHKDIAMLYGCPNEGSTLTKQREDGFFEAMNEAGIAVRDDWVLDGKMSIEGARPVTRKLLHYGSPPTAIFCANDEMAIGAMHEIKQAGLKVPDDISIIGFDDIRFAPVADPPLTTIAQPAWEIGARTMNLMCRVIDGHDVEAVTEIVQHQLVVRNSTAPPK